MQIYLSIFMLLIDNINENNFYYFLNFKLPI